MPQTNLQLVQKLIDEGTLKTPQIIAAFKKIDRKDFAGEENASYVYEDHPLSIKYEATISQPTTVAIILELLQPQKGDIILDLGSGSGWTTALLAHIVGPKGKVYGVELIPQLVEFGQKNLQRYGFKNAQILQADAENIGLSDKAPLDKILVSASAQNLPEELINQLKVGGRLLIPIQNSIWKIEKISENKLEKEEYPGFAFVPLK